MIVDGATPYRDAWAASKQATVAQVMQAAAGVARELSHCGIELDRITRELQRSASFSDLYARVERLAEISRTIAYNAHNLKFVCDLQIPPSSVYVDQYLNQFLLMSVAKRTWWVEGPAFCGLAIEQGARVLELGCGTGYYTDVFYAPFASDVVAIDIDPRAIETARRLHQAKNIRYEVMDFREELPAGPFDTVVWTPTIFAYSPDDVDAMMPKLRATMVDGARLCGFTCIEVEQAGPGILWHDTRSLAERLKRYFANVLAFERVHSTMRPPRHELFFFASDGTLPLDPQWPHAVRR
jgi:SAM-dependent methyltransferase